MICATRGNPMLSPLGHLCLKKGILMELIQKRTRTVQTTQDSGFEEFWRIYPNRPGDNKQEAFRQWVARLKQGEDPGLILAGARRYAAYCKFNIEDPKFVKKAATFIGRDRHYLLEWKVLKNGKSEIFDRWLTGNSGGEDGIIDV